MRLEFDVRGTPAPQGSKRGFVVKGRVVMTESSKKVKPWRDDVARAADEAIARLEGFTMMTGPIRLTIRFRFARPASHYGTKGNVRASAPSHKTTYPDLSKLVRSTEDALTKRAWRDDAQVVELHVAKYFDVWQGAHIEIQEVDGGGF